MVLAFCKWYHEKVPGLSLSLSLQSIDQEISFQIKCHNVRPDTGPMWWDEYYDPLGARLPALRAKHAADPGKLEMLAAIQTEIDLYRKYSAYYGNVFYLMQRD
jgi:hypothetical protein